MEDLLKRIERLLKKLVLEIDRALKEKNFSQLEKLSKKLSEVNSLKEQIAAIDSRLSALESNSSIAAGSPFGLREIRTAITEGMKKQNLLTLTEAIKQGKVRVGEHFAIEALPSRDRFETVLLASGNKLRERGKIGKFYRDAGVQAGDSVLLKEVTPGRWELLKAA